MLAEHKPIIAPLLIDPDDIVPWFSSWPRRPNFYMDDMERTKRIWRRQRFGSHWVQKVHGIVLIDLQDEQSAMVKFLRRKDGDVDVTSRPDGPGVYVLNTYEYGCLPVTETEDQELGKDFISVIQDKQLEHLSYLGNLSHPEPSTIGFDEVYVVNLARRPDRKRRMETLLQSLGIKARITEVVDGWTLTNRTLEQMGATYIPRYFEGGNVNCTLGCVGCFLSHYNIWKHAHENNYSRVLIFEDDVRLRPHFVKKVQALVREADKAPGGWDLLYVYREPVNTPTQFPPQPEGTRWNKLGEPYVTENLAKPRYSYDTLAYILSASGLEKVMSGNPLKNIIEVDIWLSLHYGHTLLTEKMLELYASRPRLLALAPCPILARPHWIGQTKFSDTDDNLLQNPNED